MIKAVLIDIDNTLLDFCKSADKTIKMLFAEKGMTYNDNVFPTFYEINEGLWKKIERKELTKPELYTLRWKLVLEALHIDYDSDVMEQDFRSMLSGVAEPVDNVYEMLDYLKGKYKLYAASNSSYEHQIKRLTSSDMLKYFEDIFVSEKVGALKPAKEFFDVCLNEIGNVSLDEVIMIGDSLTADILGGNEYGIKTIWFNPENLEIPENPKPDYTINSLLDVKTIL